MVVGKLVRVVYADQVRSFFQFLHVTVSLSVSVFLHQFQVELSSFRRNAQDSVFTYSRITYRDSQTVVYAQVVQCIILVLSICVEITVSCRFSRSQLNNVFSYTILVEVAYFQCYDTVFYTYYIIYTVVEQISSFLVDDFRRIAEQSRTGYDPFSSRHVVEVHHIPFSRSHLCQ